MKDLITIKSATSISQLGVVKSYLEDSDIICYLKDEHFGEMPPAAATSGVQLQVAESDVERALELLITGGFAIKEEYKDYSDSLTRFVEKIIAKLSDKE